MRLTLPRAARRVILFAAAIGVTAACAARSSEAGSGSRRSPEVMDSVELRSNSYSTLWDAISAHHANWLLPRGGPTGQLSPELGVWIEGSTHTVGALYLRNLRPIDVRQVRRLTTTESLHTYSWPWGGLVVTLR